jgi:hypothetical protein
MPSIVPQDRLGRRIFLVLLVLISIVLLAAPSRGGWWGGHDDLKGSGETARRSFDVGSFDAIRIEGVADVRIVWGEPCAVEVETDDNLLDLVEVEIRRGTLHLDLEDHHGDVDTDLGFRFTVTMPRLDELRIDGVGEVECEGMDQDAFALRIDGVGEVTMAGEVGRLECEMNGVGDVDLRDLVAREARVRVDGVGDLTCHVTDDLDVAVGGMGEVRYYGDPARVRDRVDGFGRIAAR